MLLSRKTDYNHILVINFFALLEVCISTTQNCTGDHSNIQESGRFMGACRATCSEDMRLLDCIRVFLRRWIWHCWMGQHIWGKWQPSIRGRVLPGEFLLTAILRKSSNPSVLKDTSFTAHNIVSFVLMIYVSYIDVVSNKHFTNLSLFRSLKQTWAQHTYTCSAICEALGYL